MECLVTWAHPVNRGTPSWDGVSSLAQGTRDARLTWCGTAQVTDVWVAGKRVLQDRKVLTLDEEDIKARVGAAVLGSWLFGSLFHFDTSVDVLIAAQGEESSLCTCDCG